MLLLYKCECQFGDLQSLLELVANEVSGDNCKQDQQLQRFYSNTLEHIKAQRDRGDDLSEQYQALKL